MKEGGKEGGKKGKGRNVRMYEMEGKGKRGKGNANDIGVDDMKRG